MRSDCPCPGMDRMRCIEAGMDDYISKPVTTESLRVVMQKWLPALATPPAADAWEERRFSQ